MERGRNDDWDSYPSDQFDSVNRDDWDEDDWEAFLLRQDALNAKYSELYETLRHHPNRDELIAREMHWDLPEGLGGYGGPPGRAPDDEDGPAEEADDLLDLAQADELGESSDGGEDPGGDDLIEVPAYALAQEFALAVEEQITARLRDRAETDEDAATVIRGALDVSAEVVNGHGIGYERDSLCGNIACCKRALACLRVSLDGLLALRQRGVLLPPEADELLHHGRELGEAIRERIEELRLRVWWR